MSDEKTVWSVVQTTAADRDFHDIYAWTAANFSTEQAESYAGALSLAMESLVAGPKTVGIKPCHDIAAGVWSIRVKYKRRQGRHVLFFEIAQKVRKIVILRILHDQMDPAQHLG